ncbi:MAG: right-handed parallel beta-helix repeat-containing protein [Candidatus Hodarchaeales archaeon]|jgi:parallel beta-helix repeat protein
MVYQITSLIQPTGGEVLSGIYNIQWTESVDNKRHDVKYKIYYQNEKVPDESAWLLVADEVNTTSYDWDTRQIVNGLYRVFILAYDNYDIQNNGVASNFFEIFNEEHTLSKPEILYPNGSEVLNGTVLVDWMDSVDSLGHQVYYDISLTSNNGTTWKLLASNLTDSQYNMSSRYLFPFTDYKLKVYATDYLGLNATDETDGPFTIDNGYPGYYYVLSNQDFSGYEIPGSGSSQDPFILSGFVYNYPDLSFVHVQGTDAYFKISNNDLDTVNGLRNVIDLRDTQNVEVMGNNVTGGDNGIFISNSYNILISNNNLYSNARNGIYVTSLNSSIISDNTVYDNAGHGIFVENSQIITISDNDVYNNGRDTLTRLSISGGSSINAFNGFLGSGIFLDPSMDINVTFNNVYGNAVDGISLEYTDHSTVYENVVFGNGESGLSLVDSSYNDIGKNIVYNNGFLVSGQTASFGRFSVKNIDGFLGTGIFLDPSNNNNIFQNEVFNNAENGLYLVNSSYNQINNNKVYRNGVGQPATASTTSFNGFLGSGIFLDPSNHNTITDNIVFENGLNGIELLESDEVTISNNSVYSNGGDGLALVNSDSNSLTENYVFNNGYGSSLTGTASATGLNGFLGSGIFLDPSNNNTIDNNHIFGNAIHGVIFEDSNFNVISNNEIFRNGLGTPSTASSSSLNGFLGSGIFLDPSEDNEISNNYIFENGMNGVELFQSNFTKVQNNSIYDNIDSGLAFIDSSYGFIIDNFIFNNGLEGTTGTAGSSGLNGFLGSGIFLDPSVGHIIDGNVIKGNGFSGIEFEHTDQSFINNNTIDNNGEYGVFFFYSDNNSITRNYIQYNGNGTIADNGNTRLKVEGFLGSGIFLDPSHNNFISDNVLVRNGGYGVDIDIDSSTNAIQRNDFIENSDFQGTAQANDNGIYNAFAGNFYSDGQGSSQPYDIDGGASNQDTTPLDYPTYFPWHELSTPTVLYPNGGERIAGIFTIEWNESFDSWGHDVTYDIWWSWDHGVLWEQIGWDIIGTSFSVDSRTVLHDGQNNLIKVIAKDGRGQFAEDVSDDRFVIKNPGKNKNNFLLVDEVTTQIVSAVTEATPVLVLLAFPLFLALRRQKMRK